MTTSDKAPVAVFTPGEREYIRRELDQFFSFFPSVAGGFALRTWRGGPQKDQPKLPPAAKSLIDRHLMRLDQSSKNSSAYLHDSGDGGLAANDGEQAVRGSDEIRPCSTGAGYRSNPREQGRRVRSHGDGIFNRQPLSISVLPKLPCRLAIDYLW